MPSFLVQEVNIASIHLHDDQKPTIENWRDLIARSLQKPFSHYKFVQANFSTSQSIHSPNPKALTKKSLKIYLENKLSDIICPPPWVHLRQVLISGMPHSLGVGVTLHFFTSRKCSLLMSSQKVTHIVT